MTAEQESYPYPCKCTQRWGNPQPMILSSPHVHVPVDICNSPLPSSLKLRLPSCQYLITHVPLATDATNSSWYLDLPFLILISSSVYHVRSLNHMHSILRAPIWFHIIIKAATLDYTCLSLHFKSFDADMLSKPHTFLSYYRNLLILCLLILFVLNYYYPLSAPTYVCTGAAILPTHCLLHKN